MTKMRLPRWLLLPVLLFVFAGCSAEAYQREGVVKVTGTLLDDGQPIHVEGLENATGWVEVGFYSGDEGASPADRVQVTVARVAADGSFEVLDGLEPGKYWLTVAAWEPYPSVDKLKGKYSKQRTKLTRDIAGETHIDIDLANAK